jgi:hypothetical protein
LPTGKRFAATVVFTRAEACTANRQRQEEPTSRRELLNLRAMEKQHDEATAEKTDETPYTLAILPMLRRAA